MQDRDWERTLQEKSFDLPPETWQRMENDLRGWLAKSAREASAPAPSTWRDRIRHWLPHRAWNVSGALALGALAIGTLLWTSSVRSAHAQFSWLPGQVLDVHGPANWNWNAGRCRIVGSDARLVLAEHRDGVVDIRLERGEATFHVDHRRKDESFSVEMGDCKVHVVGTVFTVGVDSLRPWVRVQEGRIRLEHPSGSRLVDGGQIASCRERTGIPATHSEPTVASGAPPAPPVGTSHPDRHRDRAVGDSVQVPACREGASCIRILSEFVRVHPSHPAVSEVALRWARLASRTGDFRDALAAYAIASTSPAQAGTSRLEALRLREEHLSQEREVADSLDRWIPDLKTGSSLWRGAWTLREDVARRLGDASASARARDALHTPATAESGGR